ncbi:HNH endonuclease [Haemophilus parainfluenzae]
MITFTRNQKRRNNAGNLQTMCRSCNSRKGTKVVENAL